MSALFSKSLKPHLSNAKSLLNPKPTNLKVLSRYVKLNALLAIIAAVIGLWALQLVFWFGLAR